MIIIEGAEEWRYRSAQIEGEEVMAKKIGVPLEFKYELAMKAWSSLVKGFMYVVRERHGAAEALACIERLFKMDDRTKNLTTFIKTVFKIEGNDADTIADWFETYHEVTGSESTVLEQSKTFIRRKITKCPFQTGHKDLSDWCKIWGDIVIKTINPKATLERPKAMCAGDPYCENICRIEE